MNSAVVDHDAKRNIFLALMGAIACTFAMYIYLVGSIIFGVVDRKEVEAKVRDLRAEVGVLEVEYLKLASSVTLARAHVLGFAEASNQVFTARKSGTLLSLRPNEN